MSDNAKVGDRYRITYDYTVQRVAGRPIIPGSILLGYTPDGLAKHVPPTGGDRKIVSIEKLPDPEPEWRAGDVVRDAIGNVWLLDDQEGWYGVRDGGDAPRVEPLTLLVRNGKPIGG